MEMNSDLSSVCKYCDPKEAMRPIDASSPSTELRGQSRNTRQPGQEDVCTSVWEEGHLTCGSPWERSRSRRR
jgi:hypothetical protein